MECFIIDIDGFSGKPSLSAQQIIVPREIGIVRCNISLEGRLDVTASYSMYYLGGLTEEFLEANSQTITYQQRRIHGYSIKEKHILKALPKKALHFTLPNDPVEAAQMAIDTVKWRVMSELFGGQQHKLPITLIHKGGPEGEWMRPLAVLIIKTLSRAVTVLDLNDYSCPRVNKLLQNNAARVLIQSQFTCNVGMHSGMVTDTSQKWQRHCPQAECLAFAHWISVHCKPSTDETGRVLIRHTVSNTKDVVGLILKSRLSGGRPPSALWAYDNQSNKCRNFIKNVLMRHKLYLPEKEITTVYHMVKNELQRKLSSDTPVSVDER